MSDSEENEFTGERAALWEQIVNITKNRTQDPDVLKSILDEQRVRIRTMPVSMQFFIKLDGAYDIWKFVELNDKLCIGLDDKAKDISFYTLIKWSLLEGRDKIYSDLNRSLQNQVMEAGSTEKENDPPAT